MHVWQEVQKLLFKKIDWESIVREGIDQRRYFSVRGRNLYFSARISDALGLAALEKTRSLKDYKAAFTADAVRKIHEAVMEAWPPDTNIFEALFGARLGRFARLRQAEEFVSIDRLPSGLQRKFRSSESSLRNCGCEFVSALG